MPKKKPIDRVREIALALPETSERLSHGEPTWFVRTKVFASWEDHHHGDPIVGLWLNAEPGLQEILVGAGRTASIARSTSGTRDGSASTWTARWTGIRWRIWSGTATG
jgi:hypothetical protein